MVNINIDDVRPYFDGIYIPDYEGINYCIVYRKSGSNTWLAPVTATYSDKSMTLAIAESNFDAGVTYEFAGAIVAGASNTMVTSEITNVTMPKADEVLAALEKNDILGGLPVEGGVLWCATEKVTKADLDRTVAIVKEVCA